MFILVNNMFVCLCGFFGIFRKQHIENVVDSGYGYYAKVYDGSIAKNPILVEENQTLYI